MPASASPSPGAATLGWADDLADNGRLNVVTTVAPLSSIVRNVGGTRINLRGVIPDGTDSHTFEPSPSDAAILAKADVIITNGLHLETPTEELAGVNLKSGAEIVRLGDQAIAPGEWQFDFSFPEENGDPNPHLWPDIVYAQKYAEIVRDVLKRRDPANAGYYQRNWELYNAKLQQLHEGISAAVQTIPPGNRKLLTYHDSFAYFARRYGMTVIAAVQPSDFSEPSAREVANLITQVRAERVPAIFGSEVYPSAVLEQIAAEAGAVFIDQVRDDAPPGDLNSPEHTFVGMMLRNMELMIPALGGNVEALKGLSPADTYQP